METWPVISRVVRRLVKVELVFLLHRALQADRRKQLSLDLLHLERLSIRLVDGRKDDRVSVGPDRDGLLLARRDQPPVREVAGNRPGIVPDDLPVYRAARRQIGLPRD